jgi:hypothetical protein
MAQAKKTYTDKELIDIGKKVLAQRENQKGAEATRNHIKSGLYKLWKTGDKTPISEIKFEDEQ